jgi:hypothetical protein
MARGTHDLLERHVLQKRLMELSVPRAEHDRKCRIRRHRYAGKFDLSAIQEIAFRGGLPAIGAMLAPEIE